MSTEEHIRIEIGFDGTQIMSALVTPETADELEAALKNGNDGSVVLDAQDGRYTIPLGRVVYLKRFAREGRLGFGNV
ncbi:MAG TPA: hypothetical protein VFT18_06810 [Gaiellaceae bacterium]|jgi:hypothetical protein|nr:hypothetical protein [Gaiellaceae bacterium]